MLPGRDDLATKTDVLESEDRLKGRYTALREELKADNAALREELKGEIAELRTDVATLRTEMAHRYATKDDVLGLTETFNQAMQGHVRTFIIVQAATVVGMSGILFGLLRLF